MTRIFMSDGTLHFKHDWVDPEATRAPENHPYSFDAHYLWRDFSDRKRPESMIAAYSDHMHHQSPEKARAAFAGKGPLTQLGREECQRIVADYFDGACRCVGYALSCNISNGSPIGIFYVIPART